MRATSPAKYVALAVSAALLAAAPSGLAHAQPGANPDARETTNQHSAAEGASGETASAEVTSIEWQSNNRVRLGVRSPAMGRVIPVDVIVPGDRSVRHPVLYLLNGAGGGEDRATWSLRTDVEQFFADKDVYVVTPIGGRFSYYTDWVNDDPVLGRNKWTTFLTEELPPLIDDGLGTTGRNAIAGISMAGTSVLSLAVAAPGLYEAVGSYSGCASTSSAAGQRFIRMVVEGRGGGDARNMWGPYDGPGWLANDPVVHAEKLRGTELYISTGTGLPGEHDTLAGHEINGNMFTLANQVLVGGFIENAMHDCTKAVVAQLEELQIPVHAEFRDGGTHSWGYWQDDLHQSWPMLARAIGLE